MYRSGLAGQGGGYRTTMLYLAAGDGVLPGHLAETGESKTGGMAARPPVTCGTRSMRHG